MHPKKKKTRVILGMNMPWELANAEMYFLELKV